jgi:hypothetical protein
MTTFVYISPGPRNTDITSIDSKGNYSLKSRPFDSYDTFLKDMNEPMVVFIEDNLGIEGHRVCKNITANEIYLVKIQSWNLLLEKNLRK